jgi:hypothetical protein
MTAPAIQRGTSSGFQIFTFPCAHCALRCPPPERGRMSPGKSGNLEICYVPQRTLIADDQRELATRSGHSQNQILPSD